MISCLLRLTFLLVNVHACMLTSFLYSLAMPTQAFLVNPVWWLHLTEDLLYNVCHCNNDCFSLSP